MKKALIIGGTSGLGKRLAELLVDDDYFVVVTGRREQKLAEVKLYQPHKISTIKHDVTELDTCQKLFDDVLSETKTLDLVVYSSGVGGANYSLDWDLEYPTLMTNVLAATKIYGIAYTIFKKQGYGHLVGISSIASIRGNRHVPGYFASKAYQASYLESLWMKGQKSKSTIIVTDIQPGFVDTDMAIGKTFWMSTVDKATKQLYSAIKKKKKKAYITKRWFFIALLLKLVPAKLIMKLL